MRFVPKWYRKEISVSLREPDLTYLPVDRLLGIVASPSLRGIDNVGLLLKLSSGVICLSLSKCLLKLFRAQAQLEIRTLKSSSDSLSSMFSLAYYRTFVKYLCSDEATGIHLTKQSKKIILFLEYTIFRTLEK